MDNRPLTSFKDLIAWQKAMDLVDAVLLLGALLRRGRRDLASQMERAAISVPANIAEGYGRGPLADYLRFLTFAAASLREVETYALIIQRNRLAGDELVNSVLALADETARVTHGLRRSLETKKDAGPTRHPASSS